jgi:D-3-phosphoglycerate dehydrogenase
MLTILRTDPDVHIAERCLPELAQLGRVLTCADDNEETIAGMVGEADLLLTCYAPITRRVIECAPRLKGIVKYGVGVDSIDLQAAAERGMVVANCPDYGTETVADHAFALLMALSRRLPTIAAEMHTKGWIWPEPPILANDIYGKTLGLVGLGRIGRAVARRARGFNMRVLAADPYISAEVFAAAGAESLPLDDLLPQADFVSLHCVHTPETRGLLSAARLRSMKRTAYLINVSRGALIDEAALVTAVQERWLAGAALDVITNEPLSVQHPLFPLAGLSNVIITPHLAWYTVEALERIDADTLEAARDILAGRTPRNIKTQSVKPASREGAKTPSKCDG